jgi:hypothetical protein
MLLLSRGLVLTLGLLTNGLIQEQSYNRTKSFTEGFLASRDENVLLSEPNIRFRRVNYFKQDILYHRHQVDMRTTNIRWLKYKRKMLPAGSMKSEKQPTGMSGKLSAKLLVPPRIN